MANFAPLLGVQYFESLVYPNGQLPFWGSGTGVSMGAAVTEAAARKANSTMIDRIPFPYVVIKIARTYCLRFRCYS